MLTVSAPMPESAASRVNHIDIGKREVHIIGFLVANIDRAGNINRNVANDNT
jgi:hypothetical protein